ncbi:MAG TPA: D-alanyl-D-alanine carboxypeptidase [Candidatus Monoglobus merdigallinarum]|uniref:serine-type D-Ala-D-Ala carboxypeptidase n=1 Tax=Candidatus Monoglobus merdigallinarum TaxID=2838698 RepID=A0A9D1PQL5_9FIRM|nr:D-alanyl-D-alanine carboxypeptidase [Candidatus Monoglobus merdigallinarum]
MKLYKKTICITAALMSAVILINSAVFADDTAAQVDTEVSAPLVSGSSGILMEPESGTVLYEFNPDERLQIASVTKVMTMLLIFEALSNGKISYSDMVSVSEHAASMGGSQVYLEPGEQMSVDDMIKAIAIASGNDAAVAMAEFVGGSEEAFVEMMNKKAAQLGCENTHFCNCNGLDEPDDHYSSARDVAKISCALIKYTDVFKYTTIWMDSLRDGSFGLSNTNRLLKTYSGANGLKTGSTSKAKYCLSATAERNGMTLVAVVLGAPSTAERFGSAAKLLDYGFANYAVVNGDELVGAIPNLAVQSGTADTVPVSLDGNSSFIVKKGNEDKVETDININTYCSAPVRSGDVVGSVTFKIDGQKIGENNIVALADVEKINVFELFIKNIKKYLSI